MDKISVFGIGKLGICFALLCEKAGYGVMGCDNREQYVNALNRREINTIEPMVKELLWQSKNFTATCNIKKTIEYSDLIFCFVATPSLESGEYDHQHIEEVVSSLINYESENSGGLKGKTLLINCTVMPTYCKSLNERLAAYGMDVLYNPEFIAQGNIIYGLQYADYVLIGCDEEYDLIDVYEVYGRIMKKNPTFKVTSHTGAEIAKMGVNCFLTNKLSFANMIGEICLESGESENVKEVLSIIGADSRIGNEYFTFGFGAGGVCVLPSQDVITLRGCIPISNVNVNDYVISHDGRFNRVSKVFVRHYDGDMCKFKLEGFGKDELMITPEHPIYAAKRTTPRRYAIWKPDKLISMLDSHIALLEPSFIEAKDLEHGDMFAMPRVVISTNEKFCVKLRSDFKKSKNKDIEITPNLMRLFGYYLSEGHTDGKNTGFTFHESEVDFHEDVISIFKNELGLKCSHKNKSNANGNSKVKFLRSTSPVFTRFINETFGKGAENKRVPYEWIGLSDEHLINLLRGLWYGDGSNAENRFTYATISKELFTFCKLVLYKLGIGFISSIVPPRVGGDGVKHRRYYSIRITRKSDIEAFNNIIPLKSIDTAQLGGTGYKKTDKNTVFWKNNIMYYHVKEKSSFRYKGMVYNLEVDNANSYMLPQAMVHNCLPRDQRALGIHAEKVGVSDVILKTIDQFNWHVHIEYLKEKFKSKNPDKDVPFIFNQLSYKKGVDIITGSHFYRLCEELLNDGYKVIINESQVVVDAVLPKLSKYGNQVSYGINGHASMFPERIIEGQKKIGCVIEL